MERGIRAESIPTHCVVRTPGLTESLSNQATLVGVLRDNTTRGNRPERF